MSALARVSSVGFVGSGFKLKYGSASEIEEFLKQAKEFKDKSVAIAAFPVSPIGVVVVPEREKRSRGWF